MTKQEQINYWVELADEDFSTAGILIKNGKFLMCLYFCHLMTEKLLKAHFVKVNNKVPPKTHDLVYLLSITDLEMDDDKIELLDRLNFFQIEARYPDYRREVYKICTKEFTTNFYDELLELRQWIISKI